MNALPRRLRPELPACGRWFLERRSSWEVVISMCRAGGWEVNLHDWDKGDIEAEEDEVGLPADFVDHDWCELYDGVVENL